MQSLSISKVITLVEHVAIRLREPVYIHGQPGVGKSEAIAQVATKHDAELIDIRLSQYESVDMRGTPGVSKKTNLTTWHAPSTMPFVGNPAFSSDRPIILFLDEMNSAGKPVLAVAYQLINDRRVGEHKLMDNVVIVAAGNRETDRGITTTMPLPLANRFTHVEAVVSVEDWCHWAQDNGIDPLAIAFFHFRPNLLSTFELHRDKPELGKVFASPRTWVKALNYYSDAKIPDVIKYAAMEGAVGTSVTEFWSFVKTWQKITPLSEIIANPMQARLPDFNEEAGLCYAMAISCSGALSASNDKTRGAIAKYLGRFRPDYEICAWNLAVKREQELFNNDEFAAFAKRTKAVF